MRLKMKREKVEIKDCKKLTKHPKLNCACIVCGKKLDVDDYTSANAEVYPSIYEGVVFRSSGQFGSRVIDCGIGFPSGWEYEIQIIVCDECLIKKSHIVNAMKNKRAVIERRAFADVAVNWSDYDTLKQLRKEIKNIGKKKKS